MCPPILLNSSSVSPTIRDDDTTYPARTQLHCTLAYFLGSPEAKPSVLSGDCGVTLGAHTHNGVSSTANNLTLKSVHFSEALSVTDFSFSFLARDAFVRKNHRTITMMFVHLFGTGMYCDHTVHVSADLSFKFMVE